jgi:hypothetical protein
MMLGNGSFGSVAAVSGVDSPIQVAFQLATEYNEKGLLNELGRIRPIMMVGDGAHRFAVKRGLPAASRKHNHEHHITVGNIMAKWIRYRAMIDGTDVDDQRDGTSRTPQVRVVLPRVDGSASEHGDEFWLVVLPHFPASRIHFLLKDTAWDGGCDRMRLHRPSVRWSE